MSWLYYLLEANLYLAVFYGFYRIFLSEETFYNLSRYYLIATGIASFTIPLFQISYLNSLFGQDKNVVLTGYVPEVVNNGYETINMLITAIYLLVSVVFTLKLVFNLSRILLLFIKANRKKEGKITYVELSDSAAAFSFFNILFINPDIAERNTVIKHEMVHINQKHSIDIVFFEILQILGWFNPITYFIKKDIQLLHEYIADEQTTASAMPKHDYAMFLIQNSFGVIPNQLSNHIFNQSILKRRINMLNKTKSAGRAKLKFLFVLPVLGGMLCASTMAFSKEYAVVDIYAAHLKAVNSLSEVVVNDQEVPPPPPPEEPKKKITKKAKKGVKFPAPKLKKDFRYPPPIVRNDDPEKLPPPIIVKDKKDVRFPPPIVRENKKNVRFPAPKGRVQPPPPPVPPTPPAGPKTPPVPPAAPKKSDVIKN